MGKSMGSQKRPSQRMKTRSGGKSKIKGTTSRSRPKSLTAKGGSTSGQMSHTGSLC